MTRSDRTKVAVSARTKVLGTYSVVLVMLLAACGLVADGTGSYRPPEAPIAARASCDLPDIVARLDGGTPPSTDLRQGEGSVPSGFTATSVISCQTSQDRYGTTVIDEVALDGDVDAVTKAFALPSDDPKKGASVLCAYGTYAPAAIWLVSNTGAVRAAWPSLVCNLRDDPLTPLHALTETARTTIRTLPAPPVSNCIRPLKLFHATTTGHGGGKKPPFTNRPTVRLPEGPVAGLTACTYQVSRSAATGPQTGLIGSVRLSAAASTRLMRAVLAAPRAQPCDRDATEIINVILYRPDGSGGGNLAVETDGCRRLTINNLTTYRTASGDVTALLRGEQ